VRLCELLEGKSQLALAWNSRNAANHLPLRLRRVEQINV
jgi:hypothetical protein